jgi:hypothetical protein
VHGAAEPSGFFTHFSLRVPSPRETILTLFLPVCFAPARRKRERERGRGREGEREREREREIASKVSRSDDDDDDDDDDTRRALPRSCIIERRVRGWKKERKERGEKEEEEARVRPYASP